MKKYACRGADGRVIECKVRRDVLLLNGRYVLPPPPRNDDDGPHPAIQSMRRTMIKLRPLTALRKEGSALSESWPASPASWILAEDELRPGTARSAISSWRLRLE